MPDKTIKRRLTEAAALDHLQFGHLVRAHVALFFEARVVGRNANKVIKVGPRRGSSRRAGIRF